MSMVDRHRLVSWLFRETLGECSYRNKLRLSLLLDEAGREAL